MTYRTVGGLEWYEKETTVRNKFGLHARPCTDLSVVAGKYEGQVLIIYKDNPIDAKSPLEMLLNCIFQHSTVTVRVQKGDGCEKIASELAEIIEQPEKD